MLAGITLALAAAGTAASISGAQQAAAGERRAEEIRQRQMRVTADRERRQAIRAAMQTRARANVALTAQGGSPGSASAGLGQQVQDAGQGVSDTNVNENLGNLMFSANAMTSRGRSLASTGSAVQNFGMSLYGQGDALRRMTAGWGTNLNSVPNGIPGGIGGGGMSGVIK
jgi:hypothetical protein